MGAERKRHAVQWALFVPLGIVAVAMVAYLLGVDFGPLDPFMGRWSGLILQVGGGVACLTRALLVRAERRAWTLMGIGVMLYALGEAYWSVQLYGLDEEPIPSPADALWLSFYPFAYAAIALLIRARTRRARAAVWIDGVIAALAVAAVAAAVVVNAVQDTIGGAPLETATNLAYPLLDMLLLAFLAGAFAVTGWRRDRTWIWLTASLAIFAVGDSVYLYQVATETYTGGLLDSSWSLALLLTGVAAWRLGGREPIPRRLDSWRSMALPILFGAIAVAVTTYDHFTRVTVLALLLASACLLVVLVRLAVTVAQNLRMLNASRKEAVTDPLTGLANRRKLLADLDEALSAPEGETARLFVLFDLNGFKLYNDSFGHPAGDALLSRLGERLAGQIGDVGTAYRMGGDEFCALLRAPEEAPGAVVAGLADALHEQGEAFAVDCSYGWAVLPAEAGSPESALRIVDRRMYAQKHSGRTSAGAQSADVLRQALVERSPEIGPHLADVADLAEATARELGCAEFEVDQIRTAGELHDIGKVAIPDAILNKPGRLDEQEMEFVRGHSIVGERIVAAAPALAQVAKLVRAVHERFDGEGYPDRLAGEAIPLGGRVIAVCDAFHAMTSSRPYRLVPMDEASALAELRLNAGTQFDPEVVRAFSRARQSSRREPAAAHADVPAAGRR